MSKVDNDAARPVQREHFLGGRASHVQGQLGGRAGCREASFAQLGGGSARGACAADEDGDGDCQLKDLLYHGVRYTTCAVIYGAPAVFSTGDSHVSPNADVALTLIS